MFFSRVENKQKNSENFLRERKHTDSRTLKSITDPKTLETFKIICCTGSNKSKFAIIIAFKFGEMSTFSKGLAIANTYFLVGSKEADADNPTELPNFLKLVQLCTVAVVEVSFAVAVAEVSVAVAGISVAVAEVSAAVAEVSIAVAVVVIASFLYNKALDAEETMTMESAVSSTAMLGTSISSTAGVSVVSDAVTALLTCLVMTEFDNKLFKISLAKKGFP